MNSQEQYNYCQVVGCTDVGRKRQANEDCMGTRTTKNGLVAVVCDGMGGHVGGATASHVAVDAILDFLDNTYLEDPRIAIGEAIDAANRAILQKAAEQPELTGMGSTCVLLLVRDGKVFIGHVGDSRIYLVRNRYIKQLTKDHSFVQMLVDIGKLSPEEAEHHPRKNEITNALGIPSMKPATVLPDAILPEAGDCFVLCSDGLSGMVPDKVIEKVVSRQAEMRTQERADELVRLANENGGVDNITVQLVEFSITPGTTAKCKSPNKVLWAGLTVLLAALVGAGVYWGIHLLKNDPLPTEIKELGSVPFLTGKDVVKIELQNGNTVISLMDTTGQWVQKWRGEQMDLGEIKTDDETAFLMKDEEGNLANLKWKERKDTIAFEMTGTEKTYIFKVWPQAEGQLAGTEANKPQKQGENKDNNFTGQLENKMGKQPEDNKESPQESEGENTSPEALDKVLTNQVEPTNYALTFRYERNACFLVFKKQEEKTWEIRPNSGNKSFVNQAFEVKSIECGSTAIRYKKVSDDEHQFFFTDQVPADSFVIKINGRVPDTSENISEISVITFTMKKEQ